MSRVFRFMLHGKEAAEFLSVCEDSEVKARVLLLIDDVELEFTTSIYVHKDGSGNYKELTCLGGVVRYTFPLHLLRSVEVKLFDMTITHVKVTFNNSGLPF